MRVGKALIAWVLWYGACVGHLRGQTPNALPDTAHTKLSQLALHEWALLYREFHTEFLECLFGSAQGGTVTVLYGVLADVKPSHSRNGSVTPAADGMCAIPHDSLVGIAHNHPKDCEPFQSACGLQQQDSSSMHPVDSDPCYESFADFKTFAASELEVNVVVCGVGKLYVQRRGGRPNDRANVCTYNPEHDVPKLTCGTP